MSIADGSIRIQCNLGYEGRIMPHAQVRNRMDGWILNGTETGVGTTGKSGEIFIPSSPEMCNRGFCLHR